MSTITEDINSGLCSLDTIIGAETSKTCISQITAAKAIWAIAPGEKFNAGQTYVSELSRLILAGKLQILTGVNSFEENGGEDTTETQADGTQFVTNEGKYSFLATYTNGMFFNKALHTLKGFRKWNIIIVTNEGIWGTKSTDGSLEGFTTGMIQPAKLQLGSNSAGQKEGLMFQFVDRPELDSDFAHIVNTNARKETGVTQIELSLVNAPATTDTTVAVKAVFAQNTSEAFSGVADYASFIQSIDGGASNPTAGDDSVTSGTFVLTVAALASGEKGLLSLGTGNNYVVVGVDGDHYRSNVLSYTVV